MKCESKAKIRKTFISAFGEEVEREIDKYQYDGAVKEGNSDFGYYVRHEVTVFGKIEFENLSLEAVYRTGLHFIENDCTCAKNELDLSTYGTNKALIIINDMKLSDFENEEIINNTLEKVKKHCADIKTAEQLKSVYNMLIENKPDLDDYIIDKSSDLDDYIECEHTGWLKLDN